MWRWVGVAILAAAMVTSAHADTYQDFSIAGTYQTLDGEVSFSGGFLQLDLTTGYSLTDIGIPYLSLVPVPDEPDKFYTLFSGVFEGSDSTVSFTTDGEGSYTGGSITGVAGPSGAFAATYCAFDPSFCDTVLSGSFDGALTPTPIPSSFYLFGVGLACLLISMVRSARRNKQKVTRPAKNIAGLIDGGPLLRSARSPPSRANRYGSLVSAMFHRCHRVSAKSPLVLQLHSPKRLSAFLIPFHNQRTPTAHADLLEDARKVHFYRALG